MMEVVHSRAVQGPSLGGNRRGIESDEPQLHKIKASPPSGRSKDKPKDKHKTKTKPKAKAKAKKTTTTTTTTTSSKQEKKKHKAKDKARKTASGSGRIPPDPPPPVSETGVPAPRPDLEKQARAFFRLARVGDRRETKGTSRAKNRGLFSGPKASGKRVYPNVFSGSEAIDSMVETGLSPDRDHAVRLGNELATSLALFLGANARGLLPVDQAGSKGSPAEATRLLLLGGDGSGGGDLPPPPNTLFVDDADAFYRFGPGILGLLDDLDEFDESQGETERGVDRDPGSPHKRSGNATEEKSSGGSHSSDDRKPKKKKKRSSTSTSTSASTTTSSTTSTTRGSSKKDKKKKNQATTDVAAAGPLPRTPTRSSKGTAVLEDLFAPHSPCFAAATSKKKKARSGSEKKKSGASGARATADDIPKPTTAATPPTHNNTGVLLSMSPYWSKDKSIDPDPSDTPPAPSLDHGTTSKMKPTKSGKKRGGKKSGSKKDKNPKKRSGSSSKRTMVSTKERMVASIQKRLVLTHPRECVALHGRLLYEVETTVSRVYTGDHEVVQSVSTGSGSSHCDSEDGADKIRGDASVGTAPDSLDDIIASSARLPTEGDDNASAWTEFIMGTKGAAEANEKAKQRREAALPQLGEHSEPTTRHKSPKKAKKKKAGAAAPITEEVDENEVLLLDSCDPEIGTPRPSPSPRSSKRNKAARTRARKFPAIPFVAVEDEAALEREQQPKTTARAWKGPSPLTEVAEAETISEPEETPAAVKTAETPKKSKKKKNKMKAKARDNGETKKETPTTWLSPPPLGGESSEEETNSGSDEIDLSDWAMGIRKNETESKPYLDDDDESTSYRSGLEKYTAASIRRNTHSGAAAGEPLDASDDISAILEQEQEWEHQCLQLRSPEISSRGTKPPSGSFKSTASSLESFRSGATMDSNELARLRMVSGDRTSPIKSSSLLGDDIAEEDEEDEELVVYREHYIRDDYDAAERDRGEKNEDTENADRDGSTAPESPPNPLPPASCHSNTSSSGHAENGSSSAGSSGSSGIMEAIEADRFFKLAQKCVNGIRSMMPPKRKVIESTIPNHQSEPAQHDSKPSLPVVSNIRADNDVDPADLQVASYCESFSDSFDESCNDFEDDEDDESFMELTVGEEGSLCDEVPGAEAVEVVFEDEEQTYYEEVTVISEKDPSLKHPSCTRATPDEGFEAATPPRRRLSRIQSAKYLPPVPEMGPEPETESEPVPKLPERKTSVYVEVHSMPDDDDMTQITMDDYCFFNASMSSRSLDIVPEDDYTINNGSYRFNSYLYPLEEEQEVDQECDTNNGSGQTTDLSPVVPSNHTVSPISLFSEQQQKLRKKRMSCSSASSQDNGVRDAEASRHQIDKILWEDLLHDDAAVVLEALEVLKNLVAMGGQGRSYMLRHGGVMVIIEAMEKQVESEAAQCLCCGILEQLASLDNEISLTIFERNGISFVEKSLEKHQGSNQLKETCEALLPLLSRHQ